MQILVIGDLPYTAIFKVIKFGGQDRAKTLYYNSNKIGDYPDVPASFLL